MEHDDIKGSWLYKLYQFGQITHINDLLIKHNIIVPQFKTSVTRFLVSIVIAAMILLAGWVAIIVGFAQLGIAGPKQAYSAIAAVVFTLLYLKLLDLISQYILIVIVERGLEMPCDE